jgi:hypothetical protein
VREALGGHIEIGLVPFGSIGLTIFGLDLALRRRPACRGRRWRRRGAGPAGHPPRAVALLMLGVFGGFFIVPLYAMMQSRSARPAGPG